MIKQDHVAVLKEVEARYPKTFAHFLETDHLRMEWQLDVVKKLLPNGGRILDLGAGLTPFTPSLQVMGYDATMVDDYGDQVHLENDVPAAMEAIRSTGVRMERENIFNPGFASKYKGYDLVMTFDTMEHMHNSPKALFHELWNNMSPKGTLWISTPNNVNIRKRVTGLFGRNKWSQMQHWYEEPVFRGHVREPDVDDYHYIARDLGAKRHEVIGRNWLGYKSSNAFYRAVTPVADHILRLRPSLCSDIHLFAHKS
jgi:2-polyprenyl-3-methyl-5-hydroxy-6-metoxy-1,4-benzoquinol methylase